MQYTGPAVFNATDTPTTREFRGIGSYAIWNTAIIIRASDNFDFRFNIDNVTDRGVPFRRRQERGRSTPITRGWWAVRS